MFAFPFIVAPNDRANRTHALQLAGFPSGCLLLTACTLGALLLALDRLGTLQLPGCGMSSACAAAAASRWGTVPGVGWPVAFLGLAYFEAMLVAWLYSRGQLPGPLRAVMHLGAVCSVLFVLVLLVERHFCVYCLGVHALHLIWVAGLHRSQIARKRVGELPVSVAGSLASFASTFALTVVVVTAFGRHADAARLNLLDTRLDSAVQGALAAVDGESCRANLIEEKSRASVLQRFSAGRYTLGPSDAAHHVVVVSDYQCPSCRTVHNSLRTLAARRDDISLSARHFPFCTECNAQIDKTRHENACRAARAAEAAGRLGGSEGFWKMHDWLFECRGHFTDEQLAAAVSALGLSRDEFFMAMASDDVSDAIRQDVQAAHDAGLQFTPLIFLDGVVLTTSVTGAAE